MRRWARRFFVLVLLAGVVAGVAFVFDEQLGGLDMLERIERLEHVQRQRRAQLAAIEARLATVRSELQASQARLEQARCQATNAEIRARATQLAASCTETRLRFAQCAGEAAERSSNGTMMGVAAGALIAALTGGASALFSVGGALLGRTGGALLSRCGEQPSCSNAPADTMHAALNERQLTTMPTCPAATMALGFAPSASRFWLRQAEMLENLGPYYESGTPVRLIRPGVIVRPDGLRCSLVEVHGGATGWIYMSEAEIAQRQRTVRP